MSRAPVKVDPIEYLAEYLWNAESERAARRPRLVVWSEESYETQEAWRATAIAAAEGMVDYLRDHSQVERIRGSMATGYWTLATATGFLSFVLGRRLNPYDL